MEDKFIKIKGDEYGRGVTIQEYKGTYSLVSSKETKDGKVYSDWAFPQTKDRTPGEKAWPVKVKLGNSASESMEMLQLLLAAFKAPDKSKQYSEQPAAPDDPNPDLPF